MRLRSSELSARALGGETIVLDLATSRYLSITGVGSRIFELLSEERSVDELVATIVAEYPDPEHRVKLAEPMSEQQAATQAVAARPDLDNGASHEDSGPGPPGQDRGLGGCL